jgi:hypothetical protein
MQINYFVMVGLMFVPIYWVQITGIVSGVIFFGSFKAILVKWGVIYCSPQVTGSFFSLLLTFCGILQIIVNLAAPEIINKYFTGILVYYVPYGILAGISVLMALIFAIVFSFKRTPTQADLMPKGSPLPY